jgi:hypothetical protein
MIEHYYLMQIFITFHQWQSMITIIVNFSLLLLKIYLIHTNLIKSVGIIDKNGIIINEQYREEPKSLLTKEEN